MVKARETGAINNRVYRDANSSIDTLTASKRLKHLCDLGLLEKRGGGTATFYVATAKLLAPWQEIQLRSANAGIDFQPGKRAPQSGEPAAQSGEFTEEPNAAQEPQKQRGKRSLQENLAVPPKLQQELELLGGRPSPNKVKHMIRSLCAWKELPLITLAALLGRTEKYVREQYLNPMIRNGELEFTIPEHPKSPNQAYRTPSTEA